MATFRALVLHEEAGKLVPHIETVDEARLPEGEVTVAVEYSSLNYKDAMVLQGQGRLVRNYPHIPGIDFAGTVERSASPEFGPGDPVVLTGWRVGEIHWGGYAEKAQVKAAWLVRRPDGLSALQAMAIGTAGFTAMLAVLALERHGLRPDNGDVLVTGGGGGVGSVAIALLSALGHRVVAATGRPELRDYLTRLGAADLAARADLAAAPSRPLDRERWAGAVDAVGGTTLATILTQLKYRASVAACGLAGGSDLPATVIPFLLRGVNLLGIELGDVPRRGAQRGMAATGPRSAARPARANDPDRAALGVARAGANDPARLGSRPDCRQCQGLMNGDGELGIASVFARWRGMKNGSRVRVDLTAAQRGQIVQRVMVEGWTSAEAAAAFGIRERLVAAWVADYRRYGMASLRDRPGKSIAAEVIRLRLVHPVRAACHSIATGLRSALADKRPAAPSPLRRSQDDRGGGS